eukprot:TRINITY_DN6695_c0_g1_i2.p1 TRINITY_DN6695_c0_g1~~TRINITY_DN6695_c0_g1_i2.p1  ORF type:complete len:628 (-),score=184.08 TRINITY_DN6695_c0_g1_i2:45-1928(-)
MQIHQQYYAPVVTTNVYYNNQHPIPQQPIILHNQNAHTRRFRKNPRCNKSNLIRNESKMEENLYQKFPNALAMFEQNLSSSEVAKRTFLEYFGTSLSWKEVDSISDKFASFLWNDAGVRKGDRVGIFLQNVPEFMITFLSSWKIGATAVSISPMSKERELTHLLNDSGSKVLITFEGPHSQIALNVWPNTKQLKHLVTTHPSDFLPQGYLKNYPELETILKGYPAHPTDWNPSIPSGTSVTCFRDIVRPKAKASYTKATIDKEEPAFLTYTSGTTGPSKGAMNTHKNIVFNTFGGVKWFRVSVAEGDVIISMAPLFHITGLILLGMSSLASGCPLVLTLQFHPSLATKLVQNYKCTFSASAITVFSAILADPIASKANLSSLRKCVSGGAPISMPIVTEFKEKFGVLIHPAYGMTETTAPSHLTPLGVLAPLDPIFKCISVGKPIYGVTAKIVDDNNKELPIGEIGEITVKGDLVVPGYWNNPDESKKTFESDGTIHTGDIGFRDQEGWYYIVDRKKDMIIASGYKIWPREVEEVIMSHPSVRETAVVGVPDSYRGETVKAYISFKPGKSATPEEIVEHCKKQMSAYKYPRQVEIVDEVPKNLSGKILRREMRVHAAEQAAKLKAKL